MKLCEISKNGPLDVPTMSARDLAKLHGVSVTLINAQIARGVSHEKEHTTDPRVAREIALDHIKEDPRYYDKLDSVLKDS